MAKTSIPVKSTGFGESNHPILPDGRTIPIPKK
jgi:hypothetical protein